MSIFRYKIQNPTLFIVCVIFTLLFVTTPFAHISSSSSKSVEIFPRDSKSYGLSYEDHVKNYWKLTLSLEEKGHPWKDPKGENCKVGQELSNASIFYLPTNEGGADKRICKIPSGLGIFIPIIVGEYSLLEFKNEGQTVNIGELPGYAKSDQDQMMNLELQINDKKFTEEEIKNYSVLTTVFNVTFADNGLFGVKVGGPTVAAADGYYVITEPLSKGTYVIYTGGDMCNNRLICPSVNDFTTNVNTTLIVE